MIKISNQDVGKENRIIYRKLIDSISVYDFLVFESEFNNKLPDYYLDGLLSWDYSTKSESTTSIISQEIVKCDNWYELDLELNVGNHKSTIQISDSSRLLLLNGTWKNINDVVIGDMFSCFPNRDDDRYKTVNKITKFTTNEDFLSIKTKSSEYVCNGIWLKCVD